MLRTLLAVLLVLPVAARAQDTAPLYNAMQTFCVATGGVPDAVVDAVSQAGGTGRTEQDVSGASTDSTAWNYRAGDEDMIVVAGTEHIPDAAGGPARDATICIVEAEDRDDASAAAIKQWVGVAPSHMSVRALTVTTFDYRQVHAVRTPVPADAAAHAAAIAAGEIWSLALRQSQTATSVQIVHIVPEAKKP